MPSLRGASAQAGRAGALERYLSLLRPVLPSVPIPFVPRVQGSPSSPPRKSTRTKRVAHSTPPQVEGKTKLKKEREPAEATAGSS